MDKIIFACVIFGAFVAVSGFGIKDIVDFVLGGGNYYPGPGYGPGYGPGQGYPGGGYPGGYPGGHRPPGPPGAHPGCPLCDSSVYSYCSHKEAHDACCCGAGSYSYGCRKTDCNFLYANSCQEFNLISGCCCVDLHRSNIVAPIAPVNAPVA